MLDILSACGPTAQAICSYSGPSNYYFVSGHIQCIVPHEVIGRDRINYCWDGSLDSDFVAVSQRVS